MKTEAKATKQSLNEMRNSMSAFQEKLIEKVWQHFNRGGKWPVLRALYRDHGKIRVKAALAKLGSIVGREDSGEGRWSRYSLTLVGVLLTSEGPRFESLMTRFFQFQRKLFQKEPEATDAKSEKVQRLLGLSAEDTALLGKLLRIVHFGGGYGGANDSWSANAMEEAEDFPKTSDLRSEFETWLFHHYRYASVVFEEERRARDSQISFGNLFGVPTEQGHASEITPSLARFHKVYPDATKLGFLIMRFVADEPFERIVKAIKQTAKKHGLTVIRADDNQFHADMWGNVRTLLHGCSFGIAVYERIDRDDPNANVGLEIGYLLAMNKPVLLLKDKTVSALQSDLAGKLYVPFDPHDPEGSIPEKLTKWLQDNGIIVPSQTNA